MIIVIDGAVATGKSTVAKKLAKALGYIYFDTGAMYRSLTWGLTKNKIDLKNEKALADYLNRFDLNIKVKLGEKYYYVDGEDVTDAIRGEAVTSKVSEVSAIPLVREKLVALQREMAQGVNAVFEGRDMGTVVFPNANLKIFLTGDPKIRAERRYAELLVRFPELKESLSFEKCLEDINRRDELDSTRAISPLKEAEDAFIVDTTNLSPDEVVYRILECRDTARKRK